MSHLYRAAALAALLLLPACASITEGHTQKLTVSSNPVGAECTLTRNGEVIAKVTTPGQLLVDKTAKTGMRRPRDSSNPMWKG